jgi:type I restriction enzyme, S subunit
MAVQQVPLGEVLHRETRAVAVEPSSTYPNIGLLNRARGVFEKPGLRGAETKYKVLFQLAAGDLVYSKLFGWEGAVALVPGWADGAYVSGEFPTYSLSSQINKNYLGHVIAWEGFASQMATSTTGMGQRRQRVNPDQFERIMIPLPHPPEQLRIASRLNRIVAISTSFGEPPTAALRDNFLDRVSQRSLIGHIITLARHPVRVKASEAYPNLGILNRARGVFAKPPMLGSGTKYSTLYRVRTGQLIYSKLFGWEGSLAIVPEWADGWFVSSEFPTYDVRTDVVDLDYFRQVLRWRGLSEQLAAATSGMGQRRQRVQIDQFETLEVPLPDLPTQRRIGADLLRLAEVEDLAARRATLSAALLPAARNQAFAALT